MKAIDQIRNADDTICKNIDLCCFDRALLSKNILCCIRNIIEHACVYIIYDNKDFDQLEIYDAIKNSLIEIKKKNIEFRFLVKFHNYFQSSISHYTQDDDFSQRLMLKYLECLIKLKKLFKDKYNIEILYNLDRFPRDLDKNLDLYYENIYEKLQNITQNYDFSSRFYVWKVKPIFVKNNIIYEITLSNSTDKASKFQTFIVFSDFCLDDNYAIKANIQTRNINILNKKIPIKLLVSYSIDIRPCEFNNFAKIFGTRNTNCGNKAETKRIREFMYKYQVNLLDIVLFDEKEYENFKNEIKFDNIETEFLQILDQCRKICLNNLPSCNVLRYLLYTMKNKIIKSQFDKSTCDKLSNLHLSYGCIPFDKMPFASSLKRHNPKIYDLLNCISLKDREYEIFTDKIIKNTENLGILYTDKGEFSSFGNFEDLLKLKDKFNKKLYLPQHENRKIMEWNGKFFIKQYEDDAFKIVQILKNLSKNGLDNYKNLVNSWLKNISIDDENKKDILEKLFINSKVALIYGSAGTGKSTLINHISNLFKDKNKIFLANTNPAVENLKNKIELSNHQNTMTIQKFNKFNKSFDILFIDECSTVSNEDMAKILQKNCFDLLVLVGDNYQIQSIKYGSWFDMARDFLSKKSVFELTKVFRTTDVDLQNFWQEVRELRNDNKILELDAFGKYSCDLDKSIDDIFSQRNEDEIVLCLNYGGLYGVNNLNTLLQIYNKNPSFYLSNSEFKVGDPVLFIENNFFIADLHNNLKGIIKKIEDKQNELYFEVLIDKVFDENHNFTFGLSLIKDLGNKSIIGFCVDKNINSDDDNESLKSVPFVLGYAVSIHKSQGLEYKSVKLIITQEIGEQITHDIFYTAITRAKEELKIYWSPEIQNKVIKKFKLKNFKNDLSILKARKNI